MNPAPTQVEHLPETAPGMPVRKRLLILAVVAFVAGLPPLLYLSRFGWLSTITPAEAKESLKRGEGVLVDVRPVGQFKERHIQGAESWPLEEIYKTRSAHDLPARFRDRPLYLICNVGYSSAAARRYLGDHSIGPCYGVRGGIQEWIASVKSQHGGPFERFELASGEIVELPFRASPWHEQFLAVLSGFVIKPTYTLLALALAVVLWRSRSPDLAALRWAMIAFFIGENACAANSILFGDTCYSCEYLHSLGMLLCFGLATFALLEGIDRRVLMLSEPGKKCAATGLCGGCTKYGSGACGLERMFLVIIPACMILALMPACADRHLQSYNTIIFGAFYNYTHRFAYHLFETVVCPIAAFSLMAASWVVLLRKRPDSLARSKLLFAAGMGPLGFGLLRMTLIGPYPHNQVWFTLWEEVTELLFIAGVCAVLWIFRHGLVRKEAAA
jgi:rhodanese-related sulfurtransferase